MKNLSLFDANRTPLSLSNITSTDNGRYTSPIQLRDAIEDCITKDDLINNLNRMKFVGFHDFSIDRSTDTYVRVKGTDYMGNTIYLQAEFDKPYMKEVSHENSLENGYLLKSKNIVLSLEDMMNIHHFYEVACTQEYLMENYILSKEDAEIFAEEVRDIMDNELCTEEDAISKAQEKLNILLISSDYDLE